MERCQQKKDSLAMNFAYFQIGRAYTHQIFLSGPFSSDATRQMYDMWVTSTLACSQLPVLPVLACCSGAPASDVTSVQHSLQCVLARLLGNRGPSRQPSLRCTTGHFRQCQACTHCTPRPAPPMALPQKLGHTSVSSFRIHSDEDGLTIFEGAGELTCCRHAFSAGPIVRSCTAAAYTLLHHTQGAQPTVARSGAQCHRVLLQLWKALRCKGSVGVAQQLPELPEVLASYQV